MKTMNVFLEKLEKTIPNTVQDYLVNYKEFINIIYQE